MKPFRLKLLFSAALLGLFALTIPVTAQLPPSKDAPTVGQKVPDFTLPDTSGKLVRLSELLADPTGAARRSGKDAPAVLLVFYRGYW